jgi:hypothetical protein
MIPSTRPLAQILKLVYACMRYLFLRQERR